MTMLLQVTRLSFVGALVGLLHVAMGCSNQSAERAEPTKREYSTPASPTKDRGSKRAERSKVEAVEKNKAAVLAKIDAAIAKAADPNLKTALGEIRNCAERGDTRLDLGNSQLATLPPEIGELTNLTELSLNDNELTTLPPEIGRLTNLAELHLEYNNIAMLPPEIGKLSNLTRLLLYENQLTILPPEIGQLTNLTRLRLYENQLTRLPPRNWEAHKSDVVGTRKQSINNTTA